jgi:hypothetical protein
MWGGGVEESKFCLFWVVFPVRYISSVSPRFYFRKHTSCFFPLGAILESSGPCILNLLVKFVSSHLESIKLQMPLMEMKTTYYLLWSS